MPRLRGHHKNEKIVPVVDFHPGSIGSHSYLVLFPIGFCPGRSFNGDVSFFLLRKEWSKIPSLFFISTFWLVSFIGFYFISLRYLLRSVPLLQYWIKGPAPSELRALIAYPILFFKIFQNPLGFQLIGLAAFDFFPGFFAISHKEAREIFVPLFTHFFTALAFLLRTYPFRNRLILFFWSQYFCFSFQRELRYFLQKRVYF